MRFSLRTLLIVFVVVGLALATILSTWKLQRVEREVQHLYDAYGAGGPGSYRMVTVGEEGNADFGDLRLLNVDAPQNYQVHGVYYDGATKRLQRQPIGLYDSDFQFALWHSTSSGKQEFYLQSVKNYSKVNSYMLHLPADEVVYSYPVHAQGTVSDAPFLLYVLCPAGLKDEPNFQWMDRDLEKIKAWCDKYQSKVVYFEFVKRK